MARTPRTLTWLKWISWAAIAACLVAIISAVPVDTAVERLKTGVDSLGTAGYVAFIAAYILAALLFVPGSALTLAAGALFGLGRGTITVSIAATTAAALAFLIARHLARDKVAKQASRSPRFLAMDRAIGQGGWRIIALLRLSPAIPFSLGNYMFGLTGIRFLPYVLASWAFMLPGTFLYVYLGHAAGQAVEAAAGSSTTGNTAQTVFLIVGLLATVAVTVYVTKLARRAIREQTDIGGAAPVEETAVEAGSATGPTASPRVAWISAVAAVLCLGLAANRDQISRLFGPPVVTSEEAYEDQGQEGTFDHTVFDALLRPLVDPDGYVDYAGLAKDTGQLDRYISSLAEVSFDELPWPMKAVELEKGGVAARGEGSFHPVAGTVDMRFQVEFDERATAKLLARHGVLRSLVDDQGRLSLPVRVKGPLTRPTIVPKLGRLDPTDDLKKDVKELLEGVFWKKSGN